MLFLFKEFSMIQSMTGFGKASGTFSNKKITIEIRSLNSKNLDVFVRMPTVYKEKEIELRKYLGDQLDRGKIECNFVIESHGEEKSYSINKELAGRYYAEIVDLAGFLELNTDDVLNTILKMPDIIVSDVDEVNEEEWTFIMKLVKEAVDHHKNFRIHEGEALHQEFKTRIENIKAAFAQIPQYEKERIEDIKNRIESNLEEFVGGAKVDKNRFEQELIYYIEKIDIAEEKQRLAKHLDYFLEIMDQPISQGKKLGFISQEIGREINTLGSKSYHSEMQKLVVDMKDELEKIKEQVLNTL
ncbi:YicC family protein [Paracrocinitomix mangrovi]|uniref:YicC/YloC family endoribonuclease n=1 Tax=Paracrocinitomix mangrovi TaxID=2862509 RepID=UPI001EDC09A7|nr:YicC/YloC family endoribonuclease [Paracrocinitomix mangrovi]UKN00801.1 YicC family protein [Paracrocinitomix mangrovi]